MSPEPTASIERFINRELSWLAFNERVLEEAADSTNLPLDRLRFAAIVSSNLDEFFMVRVAGLRHELAEGQTSPEPSGLTPYEELIAVSTRAHGLVDKLYVLTGELLASLASTGIRVVSWSELTARQRETLGQLFRDGILPVVTPLAIDSSRPFPMLSSLSVNLAVRLESPTGEARLAIVQLPSGLTRLIKVAAPATFVLLEDVLAANLGELFPGQSVLETIVFRPARDAELELDDEGGRTHLELVEREVRRRRRGGVVRLEVTAGASDELVDRLVSQLDISRDDVYVVPGPIDLRVLSGLCELPGFDALRAPSHRPVDRLSHAQQSNLFDVIDEGDLLLHHPYDAYDPVVALLAQAADDPNVLAIKQTLYRTSSGSAIIAALQRAAERGKQVTVLVELTARFDEERNIQWARTLEEAGAHVIYGVHGYKTHAKICLIVRREAQGLRRYVHLGTGNYNERTARLYTDFSLLTASQPIAEDASAFFSALTGYSDPPRFKKLVMAPTQLRERLRRLIDRERRRAEAGQPAEIMAKMNSLIDEEIIEALYRASLAGVRIRLNVRGICALRPGSPDMSANIEVVSIVDRFLEHSRVYYFLNGGAEDVYLASADWMMRNLDKRIELMFPVETQALKNQVMVALRAMFQDTVRSRWLGPDAIYRRRPLNSGEEPFRVQTYLANEAARAALVAREGVGVVFQPEQRD
jgi:polyphosphate kinase